MEIIGMDLQSLGLLMDGIGIFLLFAFSDFLYKSKIVKAGEIITAEDINSPMTSWKWVGSGMVLLGFGLQFLDSAGF